MNVNVVRLEQWQSRTPPPAPSTPASVGEDVKWVLKACADIKKVGLSLSGMEMVAERLARHIQGKEGVKL